jgi:hypothetical protein
MVAVAQSRYWRQEDAEVALAALTDSGRSLSDFARQWGINEGRLRRWQMRLGDTTIRALVPTFQPVEVVFEDRPAASSGVELLMRSGHRVALQRGFDAQVLRDLLRAVDDTAC